MDEAIQFNCHNYIAWTISQTMIRDIVYSVWHQRLHEIPNKHMLYLWKNGTYYCVIHHTWMLYPLYDCYFVCILCFDTIFFCFTMILSLFHLFICFVCILCFDTVFVFYILVSCVDSFVLLILYLCLSFWYCVCVLCFDTKYVSFVCVFCLNTIFVPFVSILNLNALFICFVLILFLNTSF